MDVSGILLKLLMSVCAGRFPFGDLPPVLPLLRAEPLLDNQRVCLTGAGRPSRDDVAGGLGDAARLTRSHASPTVRRPVASGIAPRHALQVPSPSKRTLRRGSTTRTVSDSPIMIVLP